MEGLRIPQENEDYEKMERYRKNLSLQGRIQFERLLTTADGQAYLLAQAEEFNKSYPKNWTGIEAEGLP